jgi:hypothetical protein
VQQLTKWKSGNEVGVMKKLKSRKPHAKNSTKSIIAQVRKMPPPEPIRPCKGRLIDYIIDMYDAPDQLELRSVYSGAAGIRQDATNMRSYFNAARAKSLSEG